MKMEVRWKRRISTVKAKWQEIFNIAVYRWNTSKIMWRVIEIICLDDVIETGRSKRGWILLAIAFGQFIVTVMSAGKRISMIFLMVSISFVVTSAILCYFCKKSIPSIVEEQKEDLRKQEFKHNIIYGKGTMPMVGVLFALICKIISDAIPKASYIISEIASIIGCMDADANEQGLVLENADTMLTVDAWILGLVFIAIIIFPNYLYYTGISYILAENEDKR